MALDKWVAVCFLLFSIVYGYASYNYPLLPFERNLAFLPNTLPIALSILGVIISLVFIFYSQASSEETEPSQDINLSNWGEYKVGQAVFILVAMVAYALLLRPIGFIPSTILFLVGCGWILGERKVYLMIPIAATGSIGIWYLVQEVLGIFLKPLPYFLG